LTSTSGPGPSHFLGFMNHTELDTSHSVGLIWTSD